jgi:hypothetical protein
MLHAKDGQSRQSLRETEGRPRYSRAAIAAMGIAVGVGASLLARRAVSAMLRRRHRPIDANVTFSGVRLQQLARFRAPDGSHSIHGTFLAEFEPGDRSATIHVAFCPPFERLPAIEAEAPDDSSATVTLSQVLHNGVQIDVRLSESFNGKRTVTIEMVATDAATL